MIRKISPMVGPLLYVALPKRLLETRARSRMTPHLSEKRRRSPSFGVLLRRFLSLDQVRFEDGELV